MKNINKELAKMTDVEFNMLVIRMDIAQQLRGLKIEYEIPSWAYFSQCCQIPLSILEKMIVGAHDVDLMEIGKLKAFKDRLATDRIVNREIITVKKSAKNEA